MGSIYAKKLQKGGWFGGGFQVFWLSTKSCVKLKIASAGIPFLGSQGLNFRQ
jgi:hypothetical protein